MREYKYISSLSKDEINSNIVIACKDEKGNNTILIKNSENKMTTFPFATDNLMIQRDALLDLNGENIYCHIITALKNDIFATEQFEIIYEYIFKKMTAPISGAELVNLINSLEEFFKITPEKDQVQFQVGVAGELLTVKMLYESGYQDIIYKYHKDFFSKHDIEINDKTRIEIKSTAKSKRIHKFGHDQIYRKDVNVYVASVLFELSQEGKTLYELFNDVIALYSDPDNIFGLKKMMKRCGINEDKQGIVFAELKAISDFRVFRAEDLPKIEMEAPRGVTNIYYDVDCSLAEPIEIDTLLSEIS
ncbi:MAG: PD-(D/E)XK motif protein [Clostridia bacterium]|nr:PD-(D/E)XK motif protein [Clostridia bacterium]